MENLLHRQSVLARYRLPPLGAELDGFCSWMNEQGYSHSSIRGYAARISQFSLFLRRRGVTIADQVEEEHAERFIARRRRTHGRHWLDDTQRALRLLTRYLTDRGVLKLRVKAPTPHEELLDRYAKYLRNDRDLAANTVRAYSFYLKSFIKGLDQEDLSHAISALMPQDVQAFFCKCAQGKATRTRGYRVTRCRVLEQFFQQVFDVRAFFSINLRPPPARRTRSNSAGCDSLHSRSPRRIVMRESPVISRMRCMPSRPICLASKPANSRRLRSSSSLITRLIDRWYSATSGCRRDLHSRHEHRWNCFRVRSAMIDLPILGW